MATEVSQVTQTTSNIPEWAKPYAERLLGEAERLSRRGYQAYQGQMTEGFNPLQNRAFLDIGGMRTAPQLSQATGLAGLAGLGAMSAGQYAPIAQQQFYQSPFTQPSGTDQYMSQRSLYEAARERDRQLIANNERDRQLASGLSKDDYFQSSMRDDLRPNLQDLRRDKPSEIPAVTMPSMSGEGYEPLASASPSQSFQPGIPGAFSPLQQYMSPYMQGVVEQQKSQAIADYGRQLPGMAAAAARAGAKGGTREALLQSEAQRNLFDQLGNIQATGLQNAFQQAQAQAAQDAALRAQYGLAGANLREQSRQFGAGLGLQGIGQQLAAAGTLGQLGQQQYGQQLGISQAQLGAGAQIQALGQQDLTNRYQQFLDQQRLPFQQLSWFSDILRGTPASGATQTLYQQPPNVLGQITGLGLGLGSLFGGSSS